MTFSLAVVPGSHLATDGPTEYRPGVCNIGPDEIARRRRSGHLGAIATLVTLAVLLFVGAPPLARFIVALPAAMAAAGYLQAYFKFCVAFGSAGVFNFGARGNTQHVVDAAARASDRRRVLQLSLGISAIAVAIGLIAVVVPLP
jgi:hypothetical protein